MAAFFILNILFAVLSTLLVGGVAKWVAGWFTTQPNTRIAGFAAACGYAIGKYSFAKPIGGNITAPALAALGAVIGLVILWFILFRKRESAPTA